MRVVLEFSIDVITLQSAIMYCFYNNIKISKKNIKETIIKVVKGAGLNIIDFPEYWGDQIQMGDYDQDKINYFVEKYKSLLD